MKSLSYLKLPVELFPKGGLFPGVSLLLALVIIAAHWLQREHDQPILEEATARYQESGLLRLELEPYVAYVDSQFRFYGHKAFAERHARLMAAASNNYRGDLIIPDLLDSPTFVAHMAREASDMMSAKNVENWQTARAGVDELMGQLSSRQLALSTSGTQASKLLTYSFLAPSWWHAAIGATLLLFLAFPTERLLGRSLFVPLLMLPPLLAGLAIPSLMKEGAYWGSIVILLSSLAGLHLACYWRSIIGLAGFAGWLALMIQGEQWFLGSPMESTWIAAICTAVLLANFNLVTLYLHLRHKGHFFEHIPVRNSGEDRRRSLWEEPLRARFSEGLSAVSRTDFERARELFASMHQDYPDNIDILTQLFHLHKHHLNHQDSRLWCRQSIATALKQREGTLAFQLWQEYHKLGGATSDLDPAIHAGMLAQAINENRMEQAQLISQTLMDAPDKTREIVSILQLHLPKLISALEANEQTLKMSRYQQWLKANPAT